MANKILLKKSSVAAKVPLATDLDVGELAVNLVDQKLYSKKADGTVIVVGSGLGGAGDVQGPASATANAIVRYNGTTGKSIKNSVPVIDDSGNIVTTASIAIGNITSPARQIHTAGVSGSEWMIEQTGAKADGRKWNHNVFGGGVSANASYQLRILNDAGTAQTLLGYNIDGTTGKFTTTPRMIDPASVPAGSIIQAKWVDMGGGNYSGVTASYVNTGFGGTITPQFSTSKIIHIVTIGFVPLCDGNLVIARNGTVVSPSFLDNYRTIASWDWYYDMSPQCFTWMDSPGTTSAINYNIFARATGCGNSVVVGSSSDFTCSWLMLEVAA